MNTVADNMPSQEQHQDETVRQDPKAAADPALVELGKVSDTQGGWIGSKFDSGAGFQPY